MLTGGAVCALVVEDISFIGRYVGAGDLTSFQGTGTTFDCTATQAFDFKAQWGAAQVGESVFGQGVGLYIPGAPVTSVNGKTGAVTVTRILSNSDSPIITPVSLPRISTPGPESLQPRPIMLSSGYFDHSGPA